MENRRFWLVAFVFLVACAGRGGTPGEAEAAAVGHGNTAMLGVLDSTERAALEESDRALLSALRHASYLPDAFLPDWFGGAALLARLREAAASGAAGFRGWAAAISEGTVLTFLSDAMDLQGADADPTAMAKIRFALSAGFDDTINRWLTNRFAGDVPAVIVVARAMAAASPEELGAAAGVANARVVLASEAAAWRAVAARRETRALDATRLELLDVVAPFYYGDQEAPHGTLWPSVVRDLLLGRPAQRGAAIDRLVALGVMDAPTASAWRERLWLSPVG